jgi:hypothetical protein
MSLQENPEVQSYIDAIRDGLDIGYDAIEAGGDELSEVEKTQILRDSVLVSLEAAGLSKNPIYLVAKSASLLIEFSEPTQGTEWKQKANNTVLDLLLRTQKAVDVLDLVDGEIAPPEGPVLSPDDFIPNLSLLREIGDLIAQIPDLIDDFFDWLERATLNLLLDITGNDDLVDNDVNTDYNRALNWLPPRDPLVLDLDGDGIETSGVNPNLLFDHNADGIKTGTGWVNSDDGLLVMDRDGNGLIDNGRELFGDQTIKSNGEFATDGFDALRDLDANGDSIIDLRDTRFGELRVWRDLNQDGISQGNELQSLDQAGITQISLDVNDIADQNLSGGTLTQTATFTRDDKTTSTVGNVNLTDNGFYRENSVISPMRTLSINMAA